MPVSFEKLIPGGTYSRPQLAEMWGYSGYQALARGVVTPRDDNKIILFVTFDKPEYIEQYKDQLIGGTLSWEGPTDHFAEDRMIRAQRAGDQIHVFWRDRHHSDFVYEGQFAVVDYTLNANKPSKFMLRRL
jgi:hypothetical protein